MKNDPQKRGALKEKERVKYLKKKQKGTSKLVDYMTPREHREAKKKWREHCRNYRDKKKGLKNDAIWAHLMPIFDDLSLLYLRYFHNR